jgi:hypothetical protein
MKNHSSPPLLCPLVIRISIALAVLAWIALLIALLPMLNQEPDQRFGALAVIIGLPFIYWFGVLGAAIVAEIAGRLEKTDMLGPLKDLQFQGRGLMIWWCNAVIILFPATVFVVAVLGILGVLPADHGPAE